MQLTVVVSAGSARMCLISWYIGVIPVPPDRRDATRTHLSTECAFVPLLERCAVRRVCAHCIHMCRARQRAKWERERGPAIIPRHLAVLALYSSVVTGPRNCISSPG